LQISDMNWMQVEEYLKTDDRAVIPLGSTEQHGYLSLMVDTLIPEKLAREAAEPLGIPVFPGVSYGIAPYFSAFPGTVSLRVETYVSLMRDLLDSLSRSGFRRIVLVNGHGGNAPAASLATEWMADHPGHQVATFNWWSAPMTLAKIREVDPVGSHASWMENFPWTRVPGVVLPEGPKPVFDVARKPVLDPWPLREALGDGNYGGLYQRPDEEMMAIWAVAVEEAREVMEDAWV
jgi:creatinine amidohydrolase